MLLGDSRIETQWRIENNLVPTVLEKIDGLERLTGSLSHTTAPESLDKLPWNKEKDWSSVGIGLVADPQGTGYFVCILVGQIAP